MKSTALFRLSLSLLAGSLLLLLFSNYGNKKAHPDLNTLMVDAFLKRNNQGDFSQADFKKYMFYFEKGVTLKGTAIIKDGLFSANDVAAAGWGYNYSEEGPAEMTPKQWITVGGYSADVPEVPASLRHFYDPTRSAGERYLTDITNARVMGSLQKYALTNPKTDGVEWALGKPGDRSTSVQDHQYTWERGKQWIQIALKETDKARKDTYMAKAWRSLGETLHMIADNGCPPHVRNDAHPSPLWNNNSWFGNPDPYEELIDVIRRDNPAEFTTLSAGAADPDLKSRFAEMTRVQDIAHALAVFTNANFVTTETISGTDRYGNPKMQVTHPDYPYAAPRLENLNYNANDYSYNSGSGIKECIDHYYFAKLIPKMCDPYVDMECVKSQAGVLFPNIIEAGKNAIKLFIPKLSVAITSLDNKKLKGEVRHQKDNEYPDPINYSGEVILIMKDKNHREVSKIRVNTKNGTFESDGVEMPEGNKIVASIDFGGVMVESDDFGVNQGIYGSYEGAYQFKVNTSGVLEASRKKWKLDNNRISQETLSNYEKGLMDKLAAGSAETERLEKQGELILALFISPVKGNETNSNGNTKYKYAVSAKAKGSMANLLFTYPSPTERDAIDKTTCQFEAGDNGFNSMKSNKEWPYNIVYGQTMNASLNGNELSGTWTYTTDGIVQYSATFKLKKTGTR